MELLRYIQYESSLVILDSMDPITFNFNMHHLNELDIVFNIQLRFQISKFHPKFKLGRNLLEYVP